MTRPVWSRIAVVWPGLPELWRTGDGMALALGLSFSILLNLCIVTTWIWDQVLVGAFWVVLWTLCLAIWGVGAWYNARSLQTAAYSSARATEPDLFAEAQLSFLQGNWFDCERLIGRLLERRPNDVEAQLLWAAVLRETDHAEAALGLLDQVELLSGSERWRLEIARQRTRLKAQANAV